MDTPASEESLGVSLATTVWEEVLAAGLPADRAAEAGRLFLDGVAPHLAAFERATDALRATGGTADEAALRSAFGSAVRELTGHIFREARSAVEGALIE